MKGREVGAEVRAQVRAEVRAEESLLFGQTRAADAKQKSSCQTVPACEITADIRKYIKSVFCTFSNCSIGVLLWERTEW
jgi:hypothetical protein